MTDQSTVVAFADLVGYTALTQAHGDAEAVVVADRLGELAGRSLRLGVEVVKTIGDAVMLRGREVPATIETAIELVTAVHRERRYPDLRVGMAIGSVVARPGDLFGHTVNVAARLAASGSPGEVTVTREIAERAGPGFVLHPVGMLDLHNVAAPVEAFGLRPVGAASAPEVVDPVCRMRLDPEIAYEARRFDGHEFAFCSTGCAGRFDADPARYAAMAVERDRPHRSP
jgi:adenylate cyclase